MGSNPIGGTVLIASLAGARSARIAPWIAPTSSSLEDEKRVPSLLLSTARGAIRLIASLASFGSLTDCSFYGNWSQTTCDTPMCLVALTSFGRNRSQHAQR